VKFVDASPRIIQAAIEVHRTLGPGLLESAYARCLERELDIAGLTYKREVDQPLIHKGARLAVSYRLDLLVEETIVVEVKAVERLLPIHEAQTLTYLRLTGLSTALLINFQVPVLRLGLRRLTLQAPPNVTGRP
jgi:GxxExxY protein